MKKSLTLLGGLALIAMPVFATSLAHAQTGGAPQPPTSNYTGNHAPNNSTGGEAGNPTGADAQQYGGTSASNNGSNNDMNKRRHHAATPTTYNSSSAPQGGNDNPNLNSGDKGGGQPR